MSPTNIINSLIIASLLGVLTFLFVKTQSHNSDRHHQIVFNIQQLSYNDSRLNESILKFSADQFSNYDPLIEFKGNIQEYIAWFKSGEQDIYKAEEAGTVSAIDEAESSFKKKFALIEKFKSHNGILKNSLYYIPTAVENLQQNSTYYNDHQAAEQLLKQVLLYNSKLLQQHKESGNRIIDAFRSKNISGLDEIAIHAETIFRERQILQSLIGELFAIPTKQSAENIYKQYNIYNDKHLKAISACRTAMYAMAVLLLFYVTYLFCKLRLTLHSLEDSLLEVEFQKNALDHHAIVASIDSNGIITYANNKFTQTTQYSKDEIIGKPWRQFNSKKLGRSFFTEMKAELESGNCWHGEIQNKRKDNSEYWLDATVVPFLDKHENPIRYVALLTDITEKKLVENRIYRLAHYDALTELPNRAMFLKVLDDAVKNASISANKLAVMFIDLDNFKFINDTMGHDCGDKLLRIVAKHLRSSVRDCDTVARLGGDEFTVVLPDISSEIELKLVSEKILSITDKRVTLNQKDIVVSSSIGISVFPDDAHNSNTLLKNADVAMYSAKDGGKNNYFIFDEALKKKGSERMAMENDLQIAIRDDQFVLHYQPQIDTATGIIFAVEALIRWNHPERGLIYPNDFIPTLEKTGLIVEVGKWVLKEASSQLVTWKQSGFELAVSVNVSARQLQDPSLLDLTKQILSSTSLQPSDIDLELTETSLLENSDESVRLLSAYSDLGIKISLDDFGTGYSSLSYLKKLPISTLKIDRSFVRDIPTDPHDVAIAKTVIAMANSLDLKVIAEGVESKEQLEFFEEMGCDYIQGYYFSKPVDADALQQLMADWGKKESGTDLKIA